MMKLPVLSDLENILPLSLPSEKYSFLSPVNATELLFSSSSCKDHLVHNPAIVCMAQTIVMIVQSLQYFVTIF